MGDEVKFGHYEQDGDPEAKESIAWIVIGVKDDSMELLSRDALDCQPYTRINRKSNWQNSDLRSWLNEEFLQEAFSEEEQQALTERTTEGKSVRDLVFILSERELAAAFPKPNQRKAQLTAYASAKDGWSNGAGYCYFWLRGSTYGDRNRVSYVSSNGATESYYGNAGRRCVRPAINVDLSKFVPAED